MALILFFVGSLIGGITAAIQLISGNASLLQAFGTYMGFAVFIPLGVGVFAFALSQLRPTPEDEDSYGFNEA